MISAPRSTCPINRSLEMLGDQWSLLILRDICLHDRGSFRELLIGSEEGISAPVLSRRLADLVQAGFLTKAEVGRGKQGRYRLSELGLAVVPVLVSLADLGVRIDPTTREHHLELDDLDARTQDLRRRHLEPASSRAHPPSSTDR